MHNSAAFEGEIFLSVSLCFSQDGGTRTMGAGGVSPQSLLWLILLGLMAPASTLNPDDPNVCSHWERSVSPQNLQYSKWNNTPLQTLQRTYGLPATNQDRGFANNQKQKGKGGLLLGTYWGHKSRAMVMWLLEWSHHSVLRWVKAQCHFWCERHRVQVLWSIIPRCNQEELWKWILPPTTVTVFTSC